MKFFWSLRNEVYKVVEFIRLAKPLDSKKDLDFYFDFCYTLNMKWTEEYPSYIEATAREKELLEGVKLVNTGLLKSGNTETFYEINDKIRRL